MSDKSISEFLKGCPHCAGTGFVYNDALGPHLRQKRIQLGITQKEMARVLGISPQYLHDLEHGNRQWTEERVALYVKMVAGRR